MQAPLAETNIRFTAVILLLLFRGGIVAPVMFAGFLVLQSSRLAETWLVYLTMFLFYLFVYVLSMWFIGRRIGQ